MWTEDRENRRNAIMLFLLINQKTILVFKYIILKFLKTVIRLTIVAKQTKFSFFY